MAFFKFRKGGDEHPTPARAPESIEAMRTRARHRLIGASVLVLLGVIGFPLVFDSQPRPISVDIPIEIPDKNGVKPLATPAKARAAEAVVVTESDAGKPISVAPVTPSPVVTPAAKAVAKSETKSESKPEVKPEVKPVEKPAEKPPAEKPALKAAEKPLVRTDDGAKAQALLEGKVVATPASAPVALGASGRFVVQIGAFSDAVKAQETRNKLERAGMKTYTHVIQPKDGMRIRVRVGPFESKSEADKAAEKIRKLDLPAAILEL